MFNVGGLLKSVQILTTCESFQCKSRWQHQFVRVFLYTDISAQKVVHPFFASW